MAHLDRRLLKIRRSAFDGTPGIVNSKYSDYNLDIASHFCFKNPLSNRLKGKKKIPFTAKELEVICHADKLRWYASTEWFENLTMLPISDSELEA